MEALQTKRLYKKTKENRFLLPQNLVVIISICVMDPIPSRCQAIRNTPVPQVKTLLKEIEQGIRKEIPLDDWERL